MGSSRVREGQGGGKEGSSWGGESGSDGDLHGGLQTVPGKKHRREQQEEHVPQSQTDPGSNPSSAPTGCVTEGQSFNLSGLCFVVQRHRCS